MLLPIIEWVLRSALGATAAVNPPQFSWSSRTVEERVARQRRQCGGRGDQCRGWLEGDGLVTPALLLPLFLVLLDEPRTDVR